MEENAVGGGWRSEVAAVLDGDHRRIGRAVIFAVYVLIIFSALSIGVETLPNLSPGISAFLSVAEVVIVAAFTIEYVLRIVTAPKPLAYIFSFWGIVDLVAVLPFYLALGLDLRALRALRLLRLIRLLKIARYSVAASRMSAAFRLVREELILFYGFALLILYLCSIGIYYFEHDAQPAKFASVFDAMWWSAITLSTVGYGDVYPVTPGGRVFTVFVLFVALGIIAVPTGLFASAMSRLRAEQAEQAKADAEKK